MTISEFVWRQRPCTHSEERTVPFQSLNLNTAKKPFLSKNDVIKYRTLLELYQISVLSFACNSEAFEHTIRDGSKVNCGQKISVRMHFIDI